MVSNYDMDLLLGRLRKIDSALLALSGGLDSSFTLWRHVKQDAPPTAIDIRAGLFVHGFDIPLDDPDTFARAADKVAATLGSVGVSPLSVVTNARARIAYAFS